MKSRHTVVWCGHIVWTSSPALASGFKGSGGSWSSTASGSIQAASVNRAVLQPTGIEHRPGISNKDVKELPWWSVTACSWTESNSFPERSWSRSLGWGLALKHGTLRTALIAQASTWRPSPPGKTCSHCLQVIRGEESNQPPHNTDDSSAQSVHNVMHRGPGAVQGQWNHPVWCCKIRSGTPAPPYHSQTWSESDCKTAIRDLMTQSVNMCVYIHNRSKVWDQNDF